MNYAGLRFDVEAVDADAWSDALLDAGALSVDAADPQAGTQNETAVFHERDDDAPRWWPVSRLTVLVGAQHDAGAVLRDAARALGHALPRFETFALDDRDWVRATQAQFQPIAIADDLWIVPTWCDAPRADAINITLDPGLAFGTGAHPTTRLCLRWLREYVGRGDSVLDYGCGSGILAIAAAKLGAGRVVGTDIDPQAVQASLDNARANHVDVEVVAVDALAPGRYDIVVANILANPLCMLAPALAARVASGGRIGLAGVLTSQAQAVVDAYARWFDIGAWRDDDDWVLLAGVRRADDGSPR